MRVLAVMTLVTAAVLGTSVPAQATTENVTGQVSAGRITWYTKERVISAAGTDVYLRVTSSPVDLKVWWYKCSDRNVGGSPVIFPAGSTARRKIGDNFRAGTRFCLAAFADIGEGTRTWRGTLNWNVSS